MTIQQPTLTEFHKAVADAHGIQLFDHYSEREAADIIGLSLIALRRLRSGRKISALRLSPRKVAFFGYQLVEYLLSAVETVPCHATTKSDASNSGSTGSPNNPAVTLGAALGSTPSPSKQDVYHSALRILKKQSDC